MGDRLKRDTLAVIVWIGVFVVVATVLGLLLLTALTDLLLELPVLGYAVNAVVIAVGGLAGTVVARRVPAPDPHLPGPRWVLLVPPVLVVAIAGLADAAWDAAAGGLVAGLATLAMLQGDRNG